MRCKKKNTLLQWPSASCLGRPTRYSICPSEYCALPTSGSSKTSATRRKAAYGRDLLQLFGELQHVQDSVEVLQTAHGGHLPVEFPTVVREGKTLQHPNYGQLLANSQIIQLPPGHRGRKHLAGVPERPLPPERVEWCDFWMALLASAVPLLGSAHLALCNMRCKKGRIPDAEIYDL